MRFSKGVLRGRFTVINTHIFFKKEDPKQSNFIVQGTKGNTYPKLEGERKY